MIKIICFNLVMMDFIATRILAEVICPDVQVLGKTDFNIRSYSRQMHPPEVHFISILEPTSETDDITCHVIQDIVNTHNELREKVAEGRVANQPPASNMRKMYWDDELARNAQDWANHCTFRHNSPRDRKDARFPVGQNMGLTITRGRSTTRYMEFRKHIKSWFNEHNDYKFRQYDRKSPSTGHYTQIVWADTYLVGCGYSRYKKNSTVYKLHVCNYGPAGNYLNKKPYNVGKEPRCPRDFVLSKKFPRLCDLKKTPSSACTSNRHNLKQTMENDNDSSDYESSEESIKIKNHCDGRSRRN